MKLSLVVSGYTIRDDPGGRAQFDSEIDDLMANIRRHASAPVPEWGFPVWQRPQLHSISNQISIGVVSETPWR